MKALVKKIIAIVLGVLDAALLTVIIISAASGWRIGGGGVAVQESQGNNSRSASQQQSEQVTSVPESTEPSQASITESSAEPSQVSQTSRTESSAQPSQVSQASRTESSAQPSQASQTSRTESSAQPSQASKPGIPDSYSMSTDEYPTLEDVQGFNAEFGWVVLTDRAVPITDPTLILGGWKAYMICDPDNARNSNMEKFTNINISYGQSDMIVTVDWFYTYFSSTGKGFDDNTPDSTFKGSFSDGALDAVGSGRITLYGFYYQNGKEFAIGRMIFQDGVEAVIALIRP